MEFSGQEPLAAAEANVSSAVQLAAGAWSPNSNAKVWFTASGTTDLRLGPRSHSKLPLGVRIATFHSTVSPTGICSSVDHQGKSMLEVFRPIASLAFQHRNARTLPNRTTVSPGFVCATRASNLTFILSPPPRNFIIAPRQPSYIPTSRLTMLCGAPTSPHAQRVGTSK